MRLAGSGEGEGEEEGGEEGIPPDWRWMGRVQNSDFFGYTTASSTGYDDARTRLSAFGTMRFFKNREHSYPPIPFEEAVRIHHYHHLIHSSATVHHNSYSYYYYSKSVPVQLLIFSFLFILISCFILVSVDFRKGLGTLRRERGGASSVFID